MGRRPQDCPRVLRDDGESTAIPAQDSSATQLAIGLQLHLVAGIEEEMEKRTAFSVGDQKFSSIAILLSEADLPNAKCLPSGEGKGKPIHPSL
jgi:hypothetical protein